MLKITNADADIIRHLGYPGPVKLSSGTYFIKLATKAEALKEILGRYICENIFNIKVPALILL